MPTDAFVEKALALRAWRPLTTTFIVAFVGLVVNLLALYFLRRMQTPKGKSKRHYKGSTHGSRSNSSSNSSSNNNNNNNTSSTISYSHSHTSVKSSKEHGKRKHKESSKSEPKLILLIGIPGSGKSTWANQYLERCDHSYVIVSANEVREKITGTIDDISKEKEVCDQMINKIIIHLKEKRNVIVDTLYNMEESFRRRIINEVPTCTRYVKDFPIKSIFARARLVKENEEGKSRVCPTEIEMEEMENAFSKAQSCIKEEGWKKLLESTHHSRSKR